MRGAPTGDAARPPTVADRMSDRPAPPRAQALAAARAELDADDRRVLAGEISAARVVGLRESILAESRGRGLQRLFEAGQAYVRIHEYRPERRFGSRIVSFKGPFVEGTNWVPHFPDTWVQSHDRFEQERWAELLFARPLTRRDVRTAAEGFAFVQAASEALRSAGARPDVVLQTGRPPEAFDRGIFGALDYAGPLAVRGVNVQGALSGHGKLAGLPIFQYFAPEQEAALFVVSFDDYVLERTDPAEGVDLDLLVEVTPIDQDEAIRMVDEQPEFRRTLFRSFNDGVEGEFTREQAVIHLQLKVVLEVTAASTLRERHEPRTLGAHIRT